ncbi:hypothetical protein CLPU_1c00230 [Gottschalkia purinilytica]|uniref:Prepilin-type N-terminal cleavage/methylation domain-containing protein n=1 Tax=Gottschalkia purinilytica TaxID=1503 RepID=A0A0L0WEF3_GOTPU|nr:type II secretion system protein [Gottschalkia purinilytica]KNF09858.1 hypothetical protein CLPU_1c00230 [Gottschalkia purinilytica]
MINYDNNYKKVLKNKRGFTLIEVIVVVAILGILFAIMIPNFMNIMKDSKLKADLITAANIAKITEIYSTINEDAKDENNLIEKLKKNNYVKEEDLKSQYYNRENAFEVILEKSGKVKVRYVHTGEELYPKVTLKKDNNI